MLKTISFYTPSINTDTTRGYGTAGFNIVRSLQALGYRVPFDDPDTRVQISLCQPDLFKFHPGQYKIGYTPWESTELPSGWVEKFNECDEVWATSQWVADVYRNQGVTRPLYVYEHGLDKNWKPVKRVPDGVVKFLHVGEPALRKGGQMTLDAFRAVFGDRDDVHLTLKCYHQNYLRSWINGKYTYPKYDNVTIIDDLYSLQEMIDLHSAHDVLVYPSYGEGFGFFPLQALGTGMPVISTGVWAPYRKFLPWLELDGRWDRSIWSLHPGGVFYPDYEHLKKLMLAAQRNIRYYHWAYYSQASQVHTEYNWLAKTKPVFEELAKRVTET